jgi:hypothetical protein
MPVPSGKEGCPNRAAIDLLVANCGSATANGLLVPRVSQFRPRRSLVGEVIFDLLLCGHGALSLRIGGSV